MSKLIRGVTYALDDGKVVKIKKWSIGKLYSMLDSIGVVLQSVTIDFKKDNYTSVDIGKIIAEASEAASSQLMHILKESIDRDGKIKEEEINEWLPEDYFGVLAKILETNLTPQLVKNLRSLRTAFKVQNKQ